MAELGAKIGVTYNAVHLYENGQRRPPVKKLPALAEALGVSVSDLVECFREDETK